ncbi:hypothetical protein GHA01_28840 [Novacetimonas hansenii]|uniref:Uncharacterized protein n=1 Tax=Novacetimonas hansenii TaxID=436 RepID=A0ABQ0SI48_NOVHA|nr:hypothetical protein Gaha_0138_022 [Novacetimonas hansenii JCM 7643]GBQ56462.1 hypothetical protein AA0243_1206 [Novacetimonas hansenii NRIC 0243]GEC65035.1 hypothetical protein GHA01_28840 [Novacetimonas hansenii]
MHAGFDPNEIIIRESALSSEVIEKSLLRGWSCRECGAGKEFADGLRKNMCGVVPDQGKCIGVRPENRLRRSVARQECRMVEESAVHTPG